MDNSLKEIIETMEDYLELVGDECGYNKKSISKFSKISHRYIKRVQKCNNENEFTKTSIDYIKKLNNLNKKCEYELIETDQRELIVSLIFDIANVQNINISIEEDFTLEYREW